MSRCKSCDCMMSDTELSRTKENGEPEDLCGECGRLVFLDLEDLFVYREYQQGHITESSVDWWDGTGNVAIRSKATDM